MLQKFDEPLMESALDLIPEDPEHLVSWFSHLWKKGHGTSSLLISLPMSIWQPIRKHSTGHVFLDEGDRCGCCLHFLPASALSKAIHASSSYLKLESQDFHGPLSRSLPWEPVLMAITIILISDNSVIGRSSSGDGSDFLRVTCF